MWQAEQPSGQEKAPGRRGLKSHSASTTTTHPTSSTWSIIAATCWTMSLHKAIWPNLSTVWSVLGIIVSQHSNCCFKPVLSENFNAKKHEIESVNSRNTWITLGKRFMRGMKGRLLFEEWCRMHCMGGGIHLRQFNLPLGGRPQWWLHPSAG